jgi:hypothetical protein
MRLSVLTGSLYLIAAGILIQATLAGMFISGTAEARMVHLIVGAILPYLAIVPTVSAWRHVSRGRVPRRVAVGATILLVSLWAQEALGHMPFPVTTVIHVPLGVALFALSGWLISTCRSSQAERHEN